VTLSRPHAGLATAIARVVTLLDDDIGLRNLHTHRFYLSLGLYTGDDIHDPHDALLDLSRNAKAREGLEAYMRQEISEMTNRYQDRISNLIGAIQHLLNVADEVHDQGDEGA
jgi:hypothetical protein